MADIDHPTTIGENTSSTPASKSQPIARPHVRRICSPFAVRLISAEVALEQMGSQLCSWLPLRGNGAMRWTFGEESLCSHQTSHSFARTMHALCMQLCLYPWTTLDTTSSLESRLHFLGKLGIFSALLTGSTFVP